ncbi:MAG TPA: efflux RND transporter periplasmic adaptor subunit [Bacteroidales bacterium]|nr:efflux RND transporter periplasmic adaptor subunit [Bacteroidales bacterium]HQK68401.1 efflux RND transporter periplasmic adaptor subunit [Bacteroidales bacterium]
MKRVLYILLTAVIICSCGKKTDKNTIPELSAPPVNPVQVSVRIVVGTGRVEPAGDIISLASPTGGIVERIFKNEGDNVKKDEPLLKLDDQLENLRADQLRWQVTSQRTEVDLSVISQKQADIKLENRSRYLESTRDLQKKGAETSQNLDDLETDVNTLKMEAEAARSKLDQARSRLKDLESQLGYAQAEVARKTLKAPSDGILLSLDASEGASINQFSSYGDFAPAGPVIVRAEIDELFADRLAEGQQAEIRYVGSDSTIATGKVMYLSPWLKKKSLFTQRAGDQEDRLVREVKVSLDNGSSLILNSRVECVIKVK